MKKILLLLLLSWSLTLKAQVVASGLLPAQANPIDSINHSTNLIGVRFSGGIYRMYAYNKYNALDTTNATGHFATKYDVSRRALKATTLSGYGITDGVTNSSLSSTLSNYVTGATLTSTLNFYATNASVSSGLSTKYDLSNPLNFINITQARMGISVTGGGGSYNNATGVINIPAYTPAVSSVFGRTGIITAQSGDYTTAQVTESVNLYFTNARARSAVSASNGVSYNSSTGNFTLSKRQEAYSGTTSGSGTYTVTFGTAYATAPNIVISCTNCNDTQRTRVTSVSTTGFTVLGRSEALGLIFTNANGLNVDVLITEK